MQPTKITDIVIGDERQRREFDTEALVELSKSIQAKGLLHAPVCRLIQGIPHLVAGERRLRAMQMLIDLDIPIVYNQTAYLSGTVPIVLISDLSEADAFEAELEENILRKDLTWQERAAAVAKLFELRKAQAPQSHGVLTSTATEIAGRPANHNDVAKLREDVIVAQFLADPEVAKATTKKDALKVIDKKLKAEHRANLAAQFDLTKTKHSLRKGDAFDLIKTIPSESVDCILTDPPYGVDASNFGSNFSLAHEYQDDWEYFERISSMLALEAFRVLKPNTHAYVFCSYEGFAQLAIDFANAGFKVWPQPLIWSKGNGNAPWITKGHRKTYECILFAAKGDRDVNAVRNDVLAYPPVSDREHGAEKPVPLLVDLLTRSTFPGDTVLDLFCGSGSIFPAADAARCVAIGFERSDDSFNLATTKLEPIL